MRTFLAIISLFIWTVSLAQNDIYIRVPDDTAKTQNAGDWYILHEYKIKALLKDREVRSLLEKKIDTLQSYNAELQQQNVILRDNMQILKELDALSQEQIEKMKLSLEQQQQECEKALRKEKRKTTIVGIIGALGTIGMAVLTLL